MDVSYQTHTTSKKEEKKYAKIWPLSIILSKKGTEVLSNKEWQDLSILMIKVSQILNIRVFLTVIGKTKENIKKMS